MRRRRRPRRQPWTSDRSVDLDGSSKYIKRATGLPSIPAVHTISMWFEHHAQSAVSYLFELGDGSNNHQIRAFRRGDLTNYIDTRYVEIPDSFTFQTAGGGSAPTINTWHHYCLTRTAGKTVTCYLDGATVGTPGSAANGPPSPTTLFAIGADVNVMGASPMDGRVSQFLIFDDVLPVADLYAHPSRPWHRHPACWFAYNPSHVGDSTDTGGTLHDWTTRGQDLTPVGTAAADIVIDAP